MTRQLSRILVATSSFCAAARWYAQSVAASVHAVREPDDGWERLNQALGHRGFEAARVGEAAHALLNLRRLCDALRAADDEVAQRLAFPTLAVLEERDAICGCRECARVALRLRVTGDLLAPVVSDNLLQGRDLRFVARAGVILEGLRACGGGEEEEACCRMHHLLSAAAARRRRDG